MTTSGFMMKAKFAGLVAAGLLGTTCAASALTITDVEVVPNPYNTLSVNSASPAYSGNPISGLILLTTSGGQTLPVFCVDLYHDIGIGSGQSIPYFSAPVTRDSSGSTSGSGNPLSAQQIGAIQTLVDIGYGDYVHHAPNLGDSLTALQGAIWDIEYGATVVSTSNANNGDINNLIGQYVTYGWDHQAAFSYGLYPVGANGQGFGTSQGFVVGAPEPSTWAMMLLGFAGLGFAGYRSGKSKMAFANL